MGNYIVKKKKTMGNYIELLMSEPSVLWKEEKKHKIITSVRIRIIAALKVNQFVVQYFIVLHLLQLIAS